jgi:para-aminobenzoate synthetase/4-amino-4-deoxychorismate lyase
MLSSFRPDPALGVFETLLVVRGQPIELQAHLERLTGSVQELYGRPLPSNAGALVERHSASLPLGRLRLTAVPAGAGSLSLEVTTAGVDPDTVFPDWEHAIALRSFVVQVGLGAHKWADRRALSEMEAAASEGCLPLLVRPTGEVLEAARSNVFAVENGRVLTPAADGRILPGVARARTIAACTSLGVDLHQESLGRQRVLEAGEAFLTGSVRGVELVRELDGTRLRPAGETIQAIVAALRGNWMGTAAAAGAISSANGGAMSPELRTSKRESR